MTSRLPRSKRSYAAFAHDVVMAFASFVVALFLRVGTDWSYYRSELVLGGGLMFTAVAALCFWYARLYQGIWRYASMNDMIAIARAVTMAVVIFVPLAFLMTRLQHLPRSQPLINWFVLMAMLGAPRFLYRWLKDRSLDLLLESGAPRIPVLLAGAGDGAELFLRAAARDPRNNYRAVGIVARRRDRVGRHIHGVPILGTLDALPAVVERLAADDLQPQRLVVTDDSFEGADVRRLLEQADGLGLALARLPRVTELRAGTAERVEVRPIAIEDLLGRPQAALDREAMRALISGRRVLVTGAGGSIGSELVRQVCDKDPAGLTLLDASEYALYRVELEVAERYPDLARRAVIADIRDAARLDDVFAEARPELVFHAAALKHVPLVEANPCEGVLTNVLGTRQVADACVAHRVAAMVQISTDKAVNPTNVMGATKRIAESYTQALDLSGTETTFVTVRFGNVLGSTGSVVPLFRRQLEAGGPLTVTHPEMTRYFMTIREAVELVLQASALGVKRAEHSGRIYVLDMGEPVKIVELARQMIRLAGLVPGEDVDIVFTGPRPGEKLFEEIFHGSEPPVPTEAKGILLATPRAGDLAVLGRGVDTLVTAARQGDVAAVRARIATLVPEFEGAPEFEGTSEYDGAEVVPPPAAERPSRADSNDP